MKRKFVQKLLSIVCAASVMMQIASPALAAANDTEAPVPEAVVQQTEQAAPAAVEEPAWANLVAGDANGNGHFGSTEPEAFVLTQASYTNEGFSFMLKLNSTKQDTRFRFVTKYVDDNNWGYIAYDGYNNGNWFYEYKANGQSGYPSLGDLPALNQGDLVKFTGTYTGSSLQLTVENLTTGETGMGIASNGDFMSLKDQPGKLGFGAARWATENVKTDVLVGGLTIGEQVFAPADYAAMTKYQDKVGTWTAPAETEKPAPQPEPEPVGAVEMHLAAGDANGNGHFNPNGSPEAFVLTAEEYTSEAFSFTVKLNSAKEDTRFRFVTKYVYDNNWSYIGYDVGSWMYQYKTGGQENWPSLNGMPAMAAGEEVKVSGVYTDAGLEITIENLTTGQKGTAVADNAQFLSLKDQAGSVGFGAGKWGTAVTDVNLSNLTVGTKTYAEADYNAMTKYADKAFTWEKAAAQQPEPPVVTTVTVTGKVVDAAGQPVEGATVVLTAGKTATTNAQGEFSVAEVAAGEYTLSVAKEGYMGATQTITVADTDLNAGEITLTVVDTNAKLWHTLKGNGRGGHGYGNGGPATALHQSQAATKGSTLTMEFKVLDESPNFGIFYYYLNDGEWLYIGRDQSSGWYYQWKHAGKEAYPKLDKLPALVTGDTNTVSIAVANEVLSVSVNGVKQTLNDQNLMALGEAIGTDPNTKLGVMTKGSTTVEFAKVAVDGVMLSNEWALLGTGELTERYSAMVTVTGKVVDADGQPLEGATVRGAGQSVKTGADGTFTMEKVESYHYNFAISKPGYEALSVEVEVGSQDLELPVQTLQRKAEINFDEQFATISSKEMKVYVGKQFPQVAKYVLKDGSGEMLGQTQQLNQIAINNMAIDATTLSADIQASSATYVLEVKSGLGVDLTMTVVMTVEGQSLTWEITNITKAEGCAEIMSISVPGLNLLTVTDVEAENASAENKPHVGFAGAYKSTATTKQSDVYVGFGDGQGFVPGESAGFMYGFLSNGKLSGGLFSNAETENDNRVRRSNSADSISLNSSTWYYERGDNGGQKYNPGDINELTFPISELPFVKVALAADTNADNVIDWNDGANALRPVIEQVENYEVGHEAIKDLVNYRIVMNFQSQASNPFLKTADSVRKVYLATDGLPQALLLKGYGNEGHDSANSEYADIAEREGGVEDFQKLIQIAHLYNTEVGVHINAQEIYPEANSMSDRLLGYNTWGGHGWGWLDQSHVIDKIYDLTSGNRWARLVQFYDRINNTSFNSAQWPAVAVSGTVADMATTRADAANRPDNMDFIYLDVWYQDTWETRNIAAQCNALGWRFSSEFPDVSEYASTWSHWATDANYGGAGMKGLNSEIIRFLTNDKRDVQVLNHPAFGGNADNPLLGGYLLYGFEGWSGDQNFNNYIEQTFLNNVPTKFLQHFQVIDWEDYAPGKSPVGNPEKQITLVNAQGDKVVVTRHEAQRPDDIIERGITLNGKLVLDDDAYLLPWQDYQGEQDKLYYFNYDGGETTWELTEGFADAAVLHCYELTDQGRVNHTEIPVTGGSVTLNLKAKTPYVLVKTAAVKELKDNFGDGNYVADPGFNGYADGEKLSAAHWTGSIADASVAVRKNNLGDQTLVLAETGKPVSVTTQIKGLKPGTKYVAEIYVDNQSDSKATVTVQSGNVTESNYTLRSIAMNWVRSDQHNNRSNDIKYLNYIQVAFVAGADTASFTLSREAGSGKVYFDDIRIVEKDVNNFRADGTFVQDFETVVQGVYPFVMGPAQGVDDHRTHLAQRNGKFTQSGWQDKTLDDVIEGEWSLKHHANNSGIIYQTIPQNFHFEPGKVYEVSFDYQSGPNGAYAFVIGDGENRFTMPAAADYFPSTAGNPATTKHHTMEVVGAPSGQTWIGLYCNGRAAGNDMGQRDFILDNLTIREKTSEEVGIILVAEDTAPYLGESFQLVGTGLENAAFEVDHPEVLTVDAETLTVHTKQGGTATITATLPGKARTLPQAASVTITVADKIPVEDTTEYNHSIEANTEEKTGEQEPNGVASALIDGNKNTYWHSNWQQGFVVSATNPAIVTMTLEPAMNLDGFILMQRVNADNGNVHKFNYEILAADGSELKSGAVVVPDEQRAKGAAIPVNFDSVTNAKKIRISITEGVNHFASLAEIIPVATPVYQQVATEAEIQAERTELKSGETVALKAVAPDGQVLKGAVWTVDDPSVATVDAAGVVTAHKAGTVKVTLSNSLGELYTVTLTVKAGDLKVEKVPAVEADCTTDGVKAYYKRSDGKFFADEACKQEIADLDAWKQGDGKIPALGHDWNEVVYEWSEDGMTCTATRTCKRDAKHVETETAKALRKVIVKATCETAGTMQHSADFVAKWAKTQVAEYEIPALGHDWNEVVYEWSEDGKTCTATRTCKNDAEHVETAEAKVTAEQTKAPTETEKGETTYTAEFAEDWAKQDQPIRKVVADVPALKPAPTEKPDPTEKPEPSEKPEPTEKPSEKPEPTEKPAEKPTEKPSEKPTEQPEVKPTEQPVQPQQPSAGGATATGDTTNMGGWILLLVVSGGVAAGVYVYSKKRKNQ